MNINQSNSDDYSCLNTSNLLFYYGYEVIKNNEYCFQVKENNKQIFLISKSEIEKKCNKKELNTMENYLIAGIGIWLSNRSV